jgi:hypothetical protein
MSELSKIANVVVSKFAKFVNEQMEIPDIPNLIQLAAGLQKRSRSNNRAKRTPASF